MLNEPMEKLYDRMSELTKKDQPLTEAEYAELVKHMPQLIFQGNGMLFLSAAQYRATVDLILSIRKFDEGSTAMMRTANRLTLTALIVAIVAVLITVIPLIFSGLTR